MHNVWSISFNFVFIISIEINIFDIVREILLKIYSKFFVFSKSIVFVINYDFSSSPFYRFKKNELCSIFFRINEKMYNEIFISRIVFDFRIYSFSYRQFEQCSYRFIFSSNRISNKSYSSYLHFFFVFNYFWFCIFFFP